MSPASIVLPNVPLPGDVSVSPRARARHTRLDGMTDVSPPIPFHLDGLEAYLRGRGLGVTRAQAAGRPVLRLDYTFDQGHAVVVLAVRDVTQHARRLELTCESEARFLDRYEAAVRHLNARNRSRPLSRSIDPTDGRFVLDYVGFYPRAATLPYRVFETIYNGVLAQFHDELALLDDLAVAG